MSMTPLEIKELFEEIIDDQVSEEMAYTLMENADQDLRDERDWAILKDSQTIARAAGDIYTTGHTLSEDFERVGLRADAVRSGSRIYFPIGMDDREQYKDSDGYYYLKFDIATSLWAMYFTGSGVGESVTIAYQKRGPEITEDVEENDGIIVWPGKRGMALAWKMASRVSSGIDGDEINFRMSPEQDATAKEMAAGMRRWDTTIRLRVMGGSTPIRGNTTRRGDGRIDLSGGQVQ